MPGLLERAASRFLGVPTREQFASLQASAATLQSEVEGLQARVRMRPGASGVKIQYGGFEYENVDKLKGNARWDVYDNMETDPLIKEGLDSVVLPLCTGKWEIQAASDKAIDKEIAEFVAANLLRQASDRFGEEYFIQTSWTGQRLVEILDFLKCGYSIFAKSTREIGGKWVYDRIQWLEPRSVDPHGWELSGTDDIIQVKRTYQTPTMTPEFNLLKPILARQLVLYPWDFKGARYEGRPKIRSLYGAFIRKDAFVRYAAIWAQKAGAPMPVGYYPESWDTPKREEFRKIVMQMRGQSVAEAYGMVPIAADGTKAELTFAGMNTAAAGQVDRMRSLIEGENSEIAHGSNTKSRLLGETKSGSRALGETQSNDEDVIVDAVVLRICEIESDGIANLEGTIPWLVKTNYPNVKKCPRLVCARVGPREDFRTLEPLISAVAAGIVPNVPALRKQITEKFGIVLKDADYAKEPTPIGAAPGAKVGSDGKPIPPSANQAGEPADAASKRPKAAPKKKDDGGRLAASDHRAARQMTIRLGLERMLRLPDESVQPLRRPQGYGRTPTQFELKVCLLGTVSEALTKGGEQVGSALRRATAAMIEDILQRIEAGKLSREDPTRLRQSRPKNYGALVNSVRERYLDVARLGRRHAGEELARQTELAGKMKAGVVSPSSVSFGMTTSGTIPPFGLAPDHLPEDASTPGVDWYLGDTEGEEATPETVLANYGRPNVKTAAYRAWLPVSSVHEPKLPPEHLAKGGYDWAGMAKASDLPPIKVAVTDQSGRKAQIVDGNHRAKAWMQAGHTHLPAWVLDERRGIANRTASLAAGDGFDEARAGNPDMLPAGAAIPIGSRTAAEIEALIQESGGSWQVISTLTTELAGEARVASVIAVDEIWARLLDEAIREYNAAIRSGLSEADALKHVERALHGLSPSKQDLAGREVAAVAYNQGRDMAAKEAAVAGAAQWVVRTEVLDSSTCEFCLHVDGTYFKVGTTDYEVHIPPAKCAGGERCRGFMVIVSDELAKHLEGESGGEPAPLTPLDVVYGRVPSYRRQKGQA